MTRDVEIVIRKATPHDSRELAELMNIAGEGLPAYLWSRMAEPGEDVMAFGARRVARTEGGFSYTNAHVADASGAIAGMLLGYRLPDSHETGPLHEYPEVVRPLIELESLAPGAWYINAVATSSAYRRRGIGAQLMRFAERLAGDAGAESLSLIVADGNSVAKKLYEHLGYRTIARRPIIQFPHCPHEGDWLLMQKTIKEKGDA